MTDNLVGWIDEVDIGRAWGRCFYEGRPLEEFAFDVALTDILECQRSYIEPGCHVSFPNGYMLVHKTIYTTYEIEKARAEAKRLFKNLSWGRDPDHS